ncbi:MAG: VOC family protein [Planctomycetota bacterium]
MLAIGDIHVYVSDFEAALRFWAEGLQLEVVDKEVDEDSSFARLEFPDGGPGLLLMASAQPQEVEQADEGVFSGISFDLTVSEFDNTLVRLLEAGGQQVNETEIYHGLRTATLADPDGNIFELLEIPPEEKAENAAAQAE